MFCLRWNVLVIACVCVFLFMTLFTNQPIKHIFSKDPLSVLTGHSRVRVLCWIMVTEHILWTSTIHINATWCKRCTKVVYFGDTDNKQFPVIGLGTPTEDRSHLTVKRNKAMDYLYKHHLKDADWFLKADSDSYVIMENLRHFLSGYNPNKPLLIGQQWLNKGGQQYPAGGGGYVLSKEALRRFGQRGPDLCKIHKLNAAEEIHLGACMDSLDVHHIDTLDKQGNTMFHQFNVSAHVRRDLPEVYTRRVKGTDLQRVSSTSISFHYLSPDDMYVLDYLIYRLRVYNA